MVDVVTTQILENGPRRIVVKFTNVSDGTGETGVVKIDATASGPYGVNIGGRLFYPLTHLKIVDLMYDISGMQVRIQWEASSNVDAFIASGAGAGPFKMLDERAGFQGIVNNGGSGVTGSIAFTTIGATSGDSYTIIMTLTKNVPQA